MNERQYSEADVRALIGAIDNPICVLRGPRMVAVNASFSRTMGFPPEELEGRPFLDLLPPEDRMRMAESARRVQEEPSLRQPDFPAVALARDGRRLQLLVHTQLLPASDGEPFVLSNCFVVPVQQNTVEIAELLVQVSTAIFGERSEAGIRRAVLETVHRAGLRAAFFRAEVSRMVPLATGPGTPLAVLDSYAFEALRERRAIFAGSASGVEISAVYLPVPERDVLMLSGSLSPHHTSAFTLFSQQLSQAFANVRLIFDLERSNQELECIAAVARLAAQPQPPSLEDLLAPMSRAVDADALVLHMVDLDSGKLTQVAQRGLGGPSERLPATIPPTTEPAIWCGAESAVGRFASGASVQLVHSGRILGVLSVVRERAVPLSHSDLRAVCTLADLLSAVLEQRRLRGESNRQLKETRLLLDLARTTAGTLEMASLLEVACDFLVRLLDTSNCFILLYDERARMLRGAASSATHRELIRSVEIPLEADSVAADAARQLKPIAVEDVTAAVGGFDRTLVERFHETALLGLPLVARGELLGVIVLDDTRGPRKFRGQMVDLAQATASQLALSLANARLYESLKESYAALDRTRNEMVKRERLAALGELSAIVAHEVRNPLGVIYNAVSSLRRMLKPSGDEKMLFDILSEESDRLNHLVGELLDFSRPREVSMQPEDVGRVIADAIDDATTAEPRAVVFDAQVEADLPQVPMDRRMIRQALMNVVLNAIQAMPRGGKLHVHARNEVRDGKRQVRIDLVDEGPGIPPEVVGRIFEPFFTTKAKGTGLGLAVVKRILEDHSGSVEVQSQPGRGTTFTFRLPVAA